jgi:hyperosmotically inducible protein
MKRNLVAALVLVAAGAMPVFAQEGTPLTDRQIQAQIERRLEKKDINRVAVGVHEGSVSLTGTVSSAWEKKTALEQAMKVKNVVGVASELTIARGDSDSVVANEIARQVRRYTSYTIFDDVNVGVESGVATLTGRVTMPYKAEEIADITARVEGVQEVRNDLQTLPVSIHDDRLRVSIARQIYRDPLFSRYAIQANPPIHVIVERGRVTLTGAVGSKVERQKAEMIARLTFGVFEVTNSLRIDP